MIAAKTMGANVVSQEVLHRAVKIFLQPHRRVNMKRLLLTVCAFGLFLSFASAEEASVKEEGLVKPEEVWANEGLRKWDLTRYAPAGKSRTVWFVYGAHPDCSSILTKTIDVKTDIKTTKEPEHGTVEIVPSENFPAFAKDNVRSKCNVRKINGFNVNYKSSGGYVGPDEFTVLVLWPNGLASQAHFTMIVR